MKNSLQSTTDDILHDAIDHVSFLSKFILVIQSKIDYKIYKGIGTNCSVRKVGRDHFQVFIPTGLGFRLYLLGSLLYQYPIEKKMRLLKISLTDRREITPYIPKRLRQIFDHKEKPSEKLSFALLSNYTDSNNTNIKNKVIFYSICLVLLHEISHVFLNHHDFFTYANKLNYFTNETIGLSKYEIMEGLEVSADRLAGMFFSKFLLEDEILQDKKILTSQHFEYIFSDHLISVSMIVSLFDKKNRSLDKKGDGYYPHPAIRYRLICSSILSSIQENQHFVDFLKPKGISITDMFGKSVEKTANFTSTLISQVLYDEISHDEKIGLPVPKSILPLSPLILDQGPFGRSVYNDYYNRSSEKGNRVEAIIQLRNFFLKTTGSPKSPKSDTLNDTNWLQAKKEIEHFNKQHGRLS